MEQALLRPCPNIKQIEVAQDGTGDPADLTVSDIELAGQYRECQKLHQGLIEAVNATHK